MQNLLVHCWCAVCQIGLSWLAKLCECNVTVRIKFLSFVHASTKVIIPNF